MKKSSLYLLLALTVPLTLTAASLAAGIGKLPRADWEGAGEIDPDQPLAVVYEGVVPLAASVEVAVQAGGLTARFDPALRGEARVKVEARRQEGIDVRLEEGALAFRASQGRDAMVVTLTLPARFDALVVAASAARVELDAAAGLDLGSLVVRSDAGTTTLKAGDVTVDEVELAVNAGKLALDWGRVTAARLRASVSAGNLEWRMAELARFTSLRVANSAGKTDLAVGALPEHALTMRTAVGKIELRRGGATEQITGLNQERVIDAAPGAPEVLLEAHVGKIEASLGR